MSVHVRNIGWSIVGPSPSSLAVLVVMSSDVNGRLFFLKFHIYVTYMTNIIYNMVDLLCVRKIRSNDHNNKKTYVQRISMSSSNVVTSIPLYRLLSPLRIQDFLAW